MIHIPAELDDALVVLVYLLILAPVLVNTWLMLSVYRVSKTRQHKVTIGSKSDDIIFAESAASEYRKAAEASERSSASALETTRINERAEEARSLRFKIEQQS